MGSPVIVAGMHRSGTSLVASFLAALGLDMGDEFIPADPGNPKGYFEDRRFVELQRQILQECTSENGGHPDWGWTEDERLDRRRFLEFRDPALALVKERNGGPEPWGWKDPRTTLFLEFWNELLDDPCFVLLYRFPWDVSDSMQRLGADVFLEHPEYAYSIWSFYNRHILDFYQRHSRRAVLVSTNALLHNPQRLAELVRDKLGIALAETPFDQVYEAGTLQRLEGSDPLIGLVAATSFDCIELLRSLDREADLCAADLWQVPASDSARSTRPREDSDHEIDLSVIIPCRDHGQFLIEAVASVERCARKGCELIIVDDGSQEPRTLEILSALKESGFRILHLPKSGLATARNRGIEAARGRYILPLDADNRLRPGFLDEAIGVLDTSPAVGVVYGDHQEFGQRSGRREVPEFDLDALLSDNFIDACAMYRKEVWSQAGGYDPAIPVYEDWELWIHAAKKGWGFHRLTGVTFDYRVRPRSLITKARQYRVQEKTIRHLAAKHRELYHQHLHKQAGFIGVWPALLERDCRDLRRELDHQQTALCRAQEKEQHLQAEREQLQTERRGLVEERDRLQEERREQRETLSAQKERLTKANGELALLGEELASRRRRMADLEASAGRYQASLRQRETELGDLSHQLQAQQAVLDRVHSSFGWRIMNRYWRWIEWLLPSSSTRRRLYDRTLKKLKNQA